VEIFASKILLELALARKSGWTVAHILGTCHSLALFRLGIFNQRAQCACADFGSSI